MSGEAPEEEYPEVWVGPSALLEVGAMFVNDVFVCGISNSNQGFWLRSNTVSIKCFNYLIRIFVDLTERLVSLYYCHTLLE